MQKKRNFSNVNILVADADTCLSQAVVHCLRAMGFENITSVRSADEALRAIRTQACSLLITEWDIRDSSGIELVRYLRRDENSPNRTLPIVMLTGRGEMHDVRMARDVGITEFVVKPFSTQTLYNRLEQIVDNPRTFVVSNAYVGPERRRRGEPPPGVADRRVQKMPEPIQSLQAFKKKPLGDAPVILAPDQELKKALGGRPLSSLITPDVLADAQDAIDKLAKDSLTWIREDLTELQGAYERLAKQYSSAEYEKAKETALSIKARSGTFGYSMASDVARLLYLFLNTDYSPTSPRHLVVIQKHIEVLMVIFAQDIKLREGLGVELYTELERLISLHK